MQDKDPVIMTAPEPNSELHEEFRSLTRLISLVASFNSNGHPGPKRLEYVGHDLRQTGNFALDALATILTRNVEVLAVAADNNVSESIAPKEASFVVAARPSELRKEPGSLNANANRWSHIFSAAGLGYETKCAPCALVPAGESHWPSVLLQEWSGLSIGDSDPLNNHVATLVDYFNHFKQTSRKDQPPLFRAFNSYVVASCWKKMHRRISHWSSQGFIYSMACLPSDLLQFYYQEYAPGPEKNHCLWRDFVLGKALLSMSHGEIVRMINQYPMEPASKPTLLLAAFRKAVENPKDKQVAYNKETCVEFHHTFVAVLASYAKALATLHVLFNNTTSTLRQKMEAAAEVKERGTLLWKFAHSPMLQHHLEGLRKCGWMHFPDDESSSFYEACFAFGDSLDERDDDEDVDQELRHLMGSKTRRPPVDSTILKWLHLLVRYFEAVHQLSHHCTRSRNQVPDVRISLLIVNTPHTTMEPWEDTVRKLVPPPSSGYLATATPFDADVAVGLIKGMRQLKGNGAEIEEQYVRWLGPTLPLFFGNVHCHAALASLIAFNKALSSSWGATSDLQGIIENLNPSVIATSRLCCPVCWELLELLRADAKSFHVGVHSTTVSPVALPSWLPASILQQMVDRFRGYLREELTAMGNAQRSHHRRESLQGHRSPDVGDFGTPPLILPVDSC